MNNAYSHTELVHFLRTSGYIELSEVQQPGQCRIQGDTVTVWFATDPQRYQLEFYGEKIERIRVWSDQSWANTKSLPELVPNALQTEHGEVYPGEHIVHPVHGVGIFRGLVREPDF